MFTQAILEMLFDELGGDFEAWVDEVGYNSAWTDQQIYEALPDEFLPYLGDFGLNASWMHGGM